MKFKLYKKARNLVLLFIFLSPGFIIAQQGSVTGTVVDNAGSLIGATVTVVGTTIGTITDVDGNYALELDAGSYMLEASYVGYVNQRTPIIIVDNRTIDIDFLLEEGLAIDEIVVVGSRTPTRTITDTPVPVDVINVADLSSSAPQTSLNQMLHHSAPSFSSNTQTISDGTDHIDPASLRGLGPDQVLVLMNGKRRHTTSLVNVNGTFGRGNVGTDLNAMPSFAVENIHILRDGASAQYGSDAIAGVIDVRMKRAVNELSFNLTTGANFTSKIGPFEGEEKSIDGEVVNLGVNYGLPLGNDGGFINVTGEFDFRGATSRMQEFSGGIFNAYNGIERVASAAGADISQLTMSDIQSYAQSVGYFPSDLQTMISSATTTSELQSALKNYNNPYDAGTDDYAGYYYDTTTDELAARGQTRSDYNMRVGQSEVRGGKFFANMEVPVGKDLALYSFGGLSYRNGSSGCFYRLPSQNRTSTSIYLNGTVPKINSNIHDKSFSAGIRGKVGEWNVDLSNTWGSNSFNYFMTDTHNATLGSSSPTTFDAGGHTFLQNTANFDVSQYYDEVGSLKGINVAFGTEYRYENYQIDPGTESSYGNYDVNGNLVTPATEDNLKVFDFYGRSRPAGSQCFAGFLPANDVNANRSSAAVYGDFEFDINEQFLIGVAGRFENYSDFGSTLDYKVASRYKVNNNLVFRAAHSSGFRAPSLHQIHFSRTSTIFSLINGVSVPQEVGVFANTSRAAKLLGIPQLEEETSQNFSLGLTAKIPESGLKITLDAYMVNIDNRIVLTGQFSPGDDMELQSIFDQAGATAASFFANAIDTKSRGLDLVVSHLMDVGSGNRLENNFAATFSKTEQDGDINASDLLRDKGLVGTYFDQTSRIYLEQAVPRVKFSLSHTLGLDKFSVYLRNTYFGETTEATNEVLFDADLNLLSSAEIDPYNSGKIITDLSFSYDVSEDLSFTLGANNLLDVFPDEADSAFQSSGRFVYSRRSPQFSYNGRYLFARIGLTLK
jgi:iron complex outermembrane receptor protein